MHRMCRPGRKEGVHMTISDLDATLAHWSDSLRLTNALYSLYKQQRARTDSYESQLLEIVQAGPLTDKDWTALRKRIENPIKPEDPMNE